MVRSASKKLSGTRGPLTSEAALGLLRLRRIKTEEAACDNSFDLFIARFAALFGCFQPTINPQEVQQSLRSPSTDRRGLRQRR